MNSVKLFLFVLSLSSIFCGCKDEYDSASQLQPSLTGKYLKVSQTNFNHISPSAFKDNFNVESSETSWQFSTVPNWVSISPSSGNSSAAIVMEGTENTSSDARTSIFYLQSRESSWSYSKAMSVSQGGVESSLTVEPSELSFSGKGETKTVLVIANGSWTGKCSQEWVDLNTVDTNELAITADTNNSDSYREATVYVSYGDNQTATISLTQFPASITSSETTLKYSNKAAKYDLNITSEIAWNAITSDSWISVTPSSGDEGETKVSIEVTPNTSVNNRTGYVSFRTADYERFQIQIEQDGLYIESVEELSFRSMENSQSLEIRSNTNWEILSAPEWLSFSKTSGTENEKITVTASENPDLASRSGVIEVGQQGLTLKCEIRTTQSGRTLSSDTTLLEFSDKAEEQSFELLSDGSWASVCSEDWFNASPASGNGDATITVSVDENTGNKERNGAISYSFGNQSIDVEIHQLGKYFNIDDEAFEFDSHGGSHTISLSTNESWTAQIADNADWLSLSSEAGDGEAEIILSVKDNPSVNSRSSEVIITPKYSQAIKISVHQKARYLNISSESIMFFSDGGTSDFVTIDTDGSYTIATDATWFSVSEEDKSGFTVTAEPYKQPDSRSGKINISLTDLKEGGLTLTLTVTQIGEGCSFIIDGYPEDSDWGDFGNTSLTFKITGYSSDKNWDTTQQPKITITKTGYTGDDDWNSKNKENITFGKDGYGTSETDWNSKNKENTSFEKDGYGSSEKDWNPKNKQEFNFNTSSYSSEKNWN